jgi:FixJ family two-component response regulator
MASHNRAACRLHCCCLLTSHDASGENRGLHEENLNQLMPLPSSPTVFVVDDEAPLRRALSRLLRSVGLAVAAFASSEEFLAQYDPHTPGCLVVDLHMPAVNGLELQRILARKGSILPIIFLTGRGDIPKSVQAMKQGAIDFLTKPVNDEDLLAAVRVAIEKDHTFRQEQTDLSEIRARLATLTPREREVLEYVVSGKLNKQIASDLDITESTVKVHRARVMAKMKVQSVAELVRLMERCGIRGSIQ